MVQPPFGDGYWDDRKISFYPNFRVYRGFLIVHKKFSRSERLSRKVENYSTIRINSHFPCNILINTFFIIEIISGIGDNSKFNLKPHPL